MPHYQTLSSPTHDAPLVEEEQAEDETYEEFAERVVVNKRADDIRRKLMKGPLAFSDMCKRNTRKQVGFCVFCKYMC